MVKAVLASILPVFPVKGVFVCRQSVQSVAALLACLHIEGRIKVEAVLPLDANTSEQCCDRSKTLLTYKAPC